MKHQLLRLALAATLLLLGAWPPASFAQAAMDYAVVAWGNNSEGQTTIPLEAQSGVTAIAAGWEHTVALRNDGSVVAWGPNDHGETTVPVAAQSGVTAVAAGGGHTVALRNDGSVVAWGLNDYGQTTVPVAAQSGVTAIAAGGKHTVALKNDGSVVAWGHNWAGQTNVPGGLGGVTGIAAGGNHTVALKNNGTVVVWGMTYDGTNNVTAIVPAGLNGVTAIAAGYHHTVALKSDGTVVAWGKTYDGTSFVAVTVPTGLVGVTAVAAGLSHTVALKNDGTVVAWGDQATVPVAAQSGVTAIAAGGRHTVALVIPTAPSITTQPVSQAVNMWRSTSFTVVATGYPLNYQWRKDGVDLAGATSATYSLLPFAHANHAGNYTVVVGNSVGSLTSAPPAVLTVNPAAPGTVVAWGWNNHGQTPIPIAAQGGVVAIASATHIVALKNDGSVLSWGGEDQTTVPLAAQSGVTAIAAGGACDFGCAGHTVALKDDGTVVAWGRNGDGQSTVPVAAQSGVVAIAAGSYHTVALKNDGTVVAWGANGNGQVTGTPAPDGGPYSATASPVTLRDQVLTEVIAIAAGTYHTVALKNDGSVVSWGGLDQTTVPVAARSGVTAIAAGSAHTVALKNDGTVVAWGYNREGQVTGTAPTDGSDFAIASPVTLGGQVLGGVTAIAAGDGLFEAGGSHTVALKDDGTVVRWGATASPDLSTAIENPVTLGGQVLSGVTAIAAGHFQTVALIGGVPLLPSLQARPNGHELILSWPTNAGGFTLQSTPDLTPPVTWLDSTTVPAVIGAQFTLTNSPAGGARFYRLRKL